MQAFQLLKSCDVYNEDKKYIDCIDTVFDAIANEIKEKQEIINSVQGFDRTTTDKFNLIKQAIDDDTFIDSLCEYLSDNKFYIQPFIGFLLEHEYDSDALLMDMENENASNIKYACKDKHDCELFDLIKKYSVESKRKLFP